MIQYIIAAGLGALVGSAQRKGKKFAMGGTTGDAEERAFAEYMDDYGVDREEADEQFLGEFDNKKQWAAEFVDDTGGMESLIDPERFYRIDKVGFRQFAQEEADTRSADIDEDNAEEYAEKLNLEIEYEDAVEADKLDDFIQRLQEEEEAAVYDDFMANYTTADEIINDLGPNYGMGLDGLERAYLIMPDYDEVADALEDDGYVFIEKDFKTFVFNPNMARGGKTQGYDDKLDESLGSRKGAGRTKEQSRKDRRDESAAMEKSMGRRKYASVGTMDKGRRTMEKGGKTGRETITYNVYNVDGNVIRSAESIADFDKGTITLPNGKKFKVKPDFDFTMKFQKTQIKAKDGLEGFVRNMKEFSSPDSPFNIFYADKFAPKEMKKGGTTKKPRKQVSDFDKLAMKVAARYRAEGKSNKEAMEIGRGTAANVARQQQAKKGKK